ncbi:40S ribosomal protein S13 [Fonticula alba]|uniref:40S ribosomal protein S13 n=1 Tax=Fonticula alba TaxID=691883 RepID=A0A058Z7N0_FONAL|nr:40S ribosomal protein S13 [Fonticula alba]KCV69502.1 40S ribosomal protein S13 [Fonticula alba]|eukprot:XP_009496067.1 40S ribosomal protein S13 [Fonticula alba]
MGRMYTPGKGKARSSLPYSRAAPSWVPVSSDKVVELICHHARRGMPPSQIGSLLRDAHGVPKIQSITGNKIVRILKANGLAPEIPEDLYQLVKKAVSIRKHLERFRKDKDAKFRLILVESRIHRLARYYRTAGTIPPNWKYESSTASAMVA